MIQRDPIQRRRRQRASSLPSSGDRDCRQTILFCFRKAIAPLFVSLLLCCLFLQEAASFVIPPNFPRYQVRNQRHGKLLSASTSSNNDLLGVINEPYDNEDEPSNSAISDGDLTIESFAQRYVSVLPEWLVEKCTALGWTHPTRIQQRALDAILFQQDDCIIQAETGSGKTLCYLLPIFAQVDPNRSTVQALIVVPTRELGLQVARVAKRLAAASPNDKVMIMSVLQGSQNRRQRAWAWAEPPHVVIGTPKELCDMVKLAGIKRYNSVKMVVVDEVDACLLNNAGSLTSNLASSVLHELLSKHLSPTYDDGSSSTNDADDDRLLWTASNGSKPSGNRPLSQQRQTIFCSATIPQHRHFLKQCQQNQWTLREPVHVCLRPGEQLLPPTLEHGYLVCAASDKKLASLRRILQKLQTGSKVLIFAEPKRPLEDMARVLALDIPNGVYCKEDTKPDDCLTARAIFSVLRYEDSLSQRAAAIDAFRGDDYQSMTSTSRQRHVNSSSGVKENADISKLRVMFSTDLAARGLDIPDITHVIHFDLPPDADTYVHRAGRTGRFGRSGQVVSIVAPEQEFVLERLGNKLGVQMRCIARQRVPNDRGS